MRVRLTLVTVPLASLAAGSVHAHGDHGLTPETLWSAWNSDPLVLVPLALAAWLYARGLRRLWARAGRGHAIGYGAVAAFALGMLALFVALISPLDALGEVLLSAHMAQHGLLVALAPPLLLAGRPGVIFAWALPARRRVLYARPWRVAARWANALSRPGPAFTLHALALWLWHAPAAFDAAVAHYGLHAAEHASFFGAALLFWRALLDARRRREAAAALAAAFATLLHSGLLGALITLAPAPLYGWYVDHPAGFGLGPLADQQLAGLLMWVPMGVVYLGACLVLASRLVAPREMSTTRPSIRPESTP